MGAYENPAMLQGPNIGKIWGQAAASFGQSIGQGIESAMKQYEQAKKEQKAENARVQRIGYEIEERAYDQANQNYSVLEKQNPGLAEQFQPMVADLLNGTGIAGEEGYKMGAIEAQTLLATKSDLGKEEKEYYRNIVQRAKLFQDRVISGGADIISDLTDMEKIKPQDIGNTHYYVGNNAKEKLTSQYSAYVLNNKEIPGATTSKNLGMDNAGNPIVSVSTVFDASSAAGKALLKDFPELESEVKNGQISFKWEKDITKLGDGFIREIPEGIDASQVYQDSGAMTDQGKFTQNMLVGNPVMRREASGAKGIDNLIETQYLNVPGLMQSQTFNAAAKAKATAIISYDPGDLKAYMQNTLELGPKYDYSSFMKKSADEKISILQELEKQKLIKTKFSGYKSRPATAEDVKYINANAKDLQSGESLAPIQEGQMIYYQETSKGTAEYRNPDRPTGAQAFQQEQDFKVLQNMVDWANENRGNLKNDLATANMWNAFIGNAKNIRIQEAADGGFHIVNLSNPAGKEEIEVINDLTDTNEMISKLADIKGIKEGNLLTFVENLQLP